MMGGIKINKKTFLIFVFVLIVFSALSAVSASENQTYFNETGKGFDSEAQIITEDVNVKYTTYDELKVHLVDGNGEDISVNEVHVNWSNKEKDVMFEDEVGQYSCFIDKNVGNYKATITLKDSYYTANPVTVNVKVLKANVKLTAKKWVSTAKQYTTLKVLVKDHNGYDVDEGTVKFTINGKKYTVKVKDGVAVKKIKLTKAKNYAYKATFTAKNYNSKSVSSKVYVKKAKKYYTLKYGKYSVKLPYKKYVKLLDAKNKNKFGYVSISTGIRRDPEFGGGYYEVGISTKDDYHTHYGYPIHDYLFLRSTSYLGIKKVNLFTSNF